MGFLGSSPDRGHSPVEWGDLLSVCPYNPTSVCTSIRPAPLGHPARPQAQPPIHKAQPARPDAQPAWLAGPEGGTDRETDGWTDRQTDRRCKEFLPILAATGWLPKGRSRLNKRSRTSISLTFFFYLNFFLQLRKFATDGRPDGQEEAERSQ